MNVSISSKKFVSFLIFVAVLGGGVYFAAQKYPHLVPFVDGGFRYVKWEILEKRGNEECQFASCVQASEFALIHMGNTVQWPVGVSVMNSSGISPDQEKIQNLIDGSVDTKWTDTNFNKESEQRNGSSTVIIDLGQDNEIEFDGYKWATADDVPERDPISWNVYKSKNGFFWELLDRRISEVPSQDRRTYTKNYMFNVDM